MTRFSILMCLLLSSFLAFSQASDFIVVKKKNNRTLKTYFPGTPIVLETVDYRYFSGIIQSVRNDSVFIKQYDVRTLMNQWGTTSVDTVGSYLIQLHYKDINKVVFDRKESFWFIKNGTLFMIGGLGYAALNVINGAYLKEPITDKRNLQSLAIALGVAGGGYVLNRIQHLRNKNGKRYRIEYIRMNDVKLKGF